MHSFGLYESYNETSQYKYKIKSNRVKTILEIVEKGNDDVAEKMVDDKLQSRNEMIDDVSGEIGVDNTNTPPPNV